MSDQLDAAIVELARDLPAGLLARLARAIAALPEDAEATACSRVARELPQPVAQAAAAKLLTAWQETERAPSPEALAFAIRILAAADAKRRAEATVQVVCSGPLATDSSLRSTEEVLLGLVTEASSDLLLSSFVAHRVDRLNAALGAAVARSVKITLILDSGSSADGRRRFNPGDVFGPELLGQCDVYTWSADSEGGAGTVHAKCVIADGRQMLVSSANLTGRALESNIELGVLLQGGPLPAQVRQHFADLIVSQLLVRA